MRAQQYLNAIALIAIVSAATVVLATIYAQPVGQATVHAQAPSAALPAQAATVEPSAGIWISPEEIRGLPASGPAWEQLRAAAEGDAGKPDLGNQDDDANVVILAKALVYARTGDRHRRDEVAEALRFITTHNTERGGRTLALGRELVAYVIAADLIDLRTLDPALDAQFRAKLSQLLSKPLEGETLRSTHETRANNWGTHAGASRAAVAAYLGDRTELERTARVFRGWLGDRSAYAGFAFGDLWWQCDSKQPVAVNPKGCLKQDRSIDGALPEEMRRGGRFRWPPKYTNYAWGALQGALVQAEILNRAGYPAWEWEDRALLRAAQFLYNLGWVPEHDDEWQPWLLNFAYGTSFPTTSPASPGKNMGWTDWTHARPRTSAAPTASPAPATATAVAEPTPQVCPEIRNRVPEAAIDAALNRPYRVPGFNQPHDPASPPGPDNPRRTWLSIRNVQLPWHPLYNGLVFKASCP